LRYNYGGPQETQNLYKEYRSTSRCSAVTRLYQEMAGNYHATPSRIQIIKLSELKASQVKRDAIKQFHDSKIKFPLTHRRIAQPRRHRTTFKAERPHTFF